MSFQEPPHFDVKKCRLRILAVIVARNEEKFLRRSLESLLDQVVQPSRVIVVDDRSTDRTADVAQEYARKDPRIKLVRRVGLSKAEHQTQIPEAFNEGLKFGTDSWDFLAKVDADIILERDYFQRITEAFVGNSRLGIAGGQTINEPSITVRGGNRVIRKECWDEISSRGFMPVMDAEDSYLDLKARYRGWHVQLIPKARSFHLRPTTEQSTVKILKHRWRIGIACYRFGYHPLLFLGRMLKIALLERPRLITLIIMSLGWTYAFLIRDKIEEELRQHQRGLQAFRVRKVLGELIRSPLKTMNKIREAPGHEERT